MMYRNKLVSELSHEELAQAMRELKLNVGPITSSTRRIYENRLKSHLLKESIQNNEEPKNNDDIEVTEKDGNENSAETNDSGASSVVKDSTDQSENLIKLMDKKPENMKLIVERSNPINSEDKPVENSVYFGVWVPYSPTRLVDKTKPNVFTSREEALKKVKSTRGSRFKSFPSKSDAEGFSLNLPSPYSVDKMCAMIQESLSVPVTEPTKTITKAPTFQELMKFRRAIEEDDLQYVQQCLQNPKFMISSSDIPVILQEGTRLNAIHVAVKYNKLNICHYLLKTLRSDHFLFLMYPNSTEDHIQFRKKHLVNLFLNTPEKMLCETPLHVACKFGFPAIVEFLLSCREVNIDAKNKDGRTSKQIICTRVNAQKESRAAIQKTIEELFEDKAFVPLYHATQSVGKVGEPIISLSKERLDLSTKNIKAYAGPMSPDKASLVYSAWKNSPKTKLFSHIANSDYEKGMERIGRALTAKENVPFAEYWHFLSTYTNFSSKDGLQKFETYLKLKTDVILAESTVNDNKTERRRISLSASKPYSHLKRSTSPDDVKRKLTFDIDTNDTDTKTKEVNKTDTYKHTANNNNNDNNNSNAELLHSTDLNNGNAEALHSADLSNGISEPLHCTDLSNSNSELLHSTDLINGNSEPVHSTDLNNGNGKILHSTDLSNINPTEECYCSCGRLLEYCDRCSVDIDLDELCVRFSSCSLSSPRPSFKRSSTKLVNGLVSFETSQTDRTEKNSIPSTLMDGSVASNENATSTVITGMSSLDISPDKSNEEVSKPPVFIDGNLPSKHDVDVFRAVENVVIDALAYPFISRWKELVTSYPDKLRTSWPSPGSPRYQKTKRNFLWTA